MKGHFVAANTRERERENTHLNDVGMVQLTEVLDFPHGRHVEAILELAHLDLLDGDLATRRELPA